MNSSELALILVTTISKKKNKNIVPDILYLKDVKDVIFNFIKNNFAPITLLLYKNAIRNLDLLFGYKPINMDQIFIIF